ncbi:MAG: Gfo/Idh/MocA family oxidoreductase [Candidatus Omnitrophica bacterium]|nr:Gfo/Idh/MocA family oxidoreductase [Candidatus Omnitrophota bacterium]
MSQPNDARVLIVGCGTMGSYHLQAVASLAQVREIEVVDPRPEALRLGRERLAETPGRCRSTTVRWLSSVEDAGRGGALCIIATQAQGRSQLLRQVAETLSYTHFLVEKLVAPSVAECEDMVDYSSTRGLSVWVNCQTRAYPFHQRVKARLQPEEPLILNVVGGNLGLATNGIHNADLFAFYDGASRIDGTGSSIDPMLHRTARGQWDLSGTLQGSTEKGSRLTMTYAGDHRLSEQLSISSRSYRCIVDHIQRWAVESEAASGGQWRAIPFGDEMLVSRMTMTFASEIIASGRCDLPALEESLVSHRFILGELQPHFNRLMGKELADAPVT